MMTTQPGMTEERVLASLGEEYARQGYRFVVHPERDELPDFLKCPQPDAMAVGPDESVAIAVGRAGRRPAAPQLGALAHALAGHEDWRLQTVFAGEPPEAWMLGSRLPGIDEIQAKSGTARRLFEGGEPAAALLLLWSVFEAIARRRLESLHLDRPFGTSPVALLKDLVSFGALEQEDDDLERILSVRNAAAHGLFAIAVPADDFARLDRAVEQLIAFTPEPDLADAEAD